MKKLEALSVAVLAALALAAGCSKKPANEAAAPAAQPAAPAAAPATAFPVEAPDSLRALAKISLDSASKLALARVATGTIDKVELEREKNALIWSFDIKVPGKTGIEEVAVNALTGAVGATEHESPAIRPATPPRRP